MRRGGDMSRREGRKDRRGEGAGGKASHTPVEQRPGELNWCQLSLTSQDLAPCSASKEEKEEKRGGGRNRMGRGKGKRAGKSRI